MELESVCDIELNVGKKRCRENETFECSPFYLARTVVHVADILLGVFQN